MHFLYANWRTLSRVGSLAFLCLLCTSLASAAPVHHRRTKSRVCDQRVRLSLRVLTARQPIGPVAPPSTRTQSGLTDSTLLLQRGHSAVFADDVAAISNDAPAASIDSELSLAPAFEPLGLVAPGDNRPSVHETFSPRSPRGPPAAA